MSEKERDTRKESDPKRTASVHQKCFIGYSTETPWRADLLAAVDEILPEFELTPWYAEQQFIPNKSLREKVLELIEHTSYGIYDISYWRNNDKGEWNVPCNVFIELGIAIALNRPILLIRNVLNEANKLPLPSCLEGINAQYLTFSGAPTLRRLLRNHLSQWLNVSPEVDWDAPHHCTFGSRMCEYRDVHPYMRRGEQQRLDCYVADSRDPDRSDFREVVEEVLDRFEDVSFRYLDMLPLNKGYDFKLCSLCQIVRSSPFAMYRITSQTPPETYIAIGISLVLERQYHCTIPKLLLTANKQDIPSLLTGYEVLIAKNDYERKANLSKVLPQVIQQVQQATWKVRPLPFIEVLPHPPEMPQPEQDEEEIEEEDGDQFEEEEEDSELEDTQTESLERRTLLHRRYSIQKTISQGERGVVYQAKDIKRQQMIVAIKERSLSTVPREERPQEIQSFKIEAKMLASFSHPNVPIFSGFFSEGGRYFMVMEYIDGATLEDLLDRNQAPFTERRVLDWARQLCDVLAYLHSQQPPIIFRNIKPGNVMLSRDGHIKLIDFGIARFFRPGRSQDTQLLGTPGFAPPEQYGSTQTDVRSDIYSLAITLFQLLTGILSETGFGLRDVRAVNPAISVQVARALEKATSLEPDDRYSNIGEFRRALLGTGSFVFENGEAAITVNELVELCQRTPQEAASYLEDGEIEAWLSEIGEMDHLRTLRHLRNRGDDHEETLQMFVQAIRERSTLNRLLVSPGILDFGVMYAEVSTPMIITIAGAQNFRVSGSIAAKESWIMLSRSQFDGIPSRVEVRVDGTQLTQNRQYTGQIILSPYDDYGPRQDVIIAVEVEIVVAPPVNREVGLFRIVSRFLNGQGSEEDLLKNHDVIPPLRIQPMVRRASLQAQTQREVRGRINEQAFGEDGESKGLFHDFFTRVFKIGSPSEKKKKT